MSDIRPIDGRLCATNEVLEEVDRHLLCKIEIKVSCFLNWEYQVPHIGLGIYG